MTVSSKNNTVRALAALVSAGAIGIALAGCTPNEPASDVPGTTPAVITGDQAPEGSDPGSHAGEGSESAGSGDSAKAELKDTSGRTVGEATFSKGAGKALTVTVKVTEGDLTPGFHGMHLHENGKCEAKGPEDSFTSAGGHLQVGGNTGHPSSGDLVSINILEDHSGETVTTTDAVTLDQIKDKAIIIHAKADNFANIPTRYAPRPDADTMKTGDAGARVACGVIEAGH